MLERLQKQANNKDVMPISYVIINKVGLNTKYIINNHYQKLKLKFFDPF